MGFFSNAALIEEATQRQNYGKISITPVLICYLGEDRPDHFQLFFWISIQVWDEASQASDSAISGTLPCLLPPVCLKPPLFPFHPSLLANPKVKMTPEITFLKVSYPVLIKIKKAEISM